jgi:hypothetical protein
MKRTAQMLNLLSVICAFIFLYSCSKSSSGSGTTTPPTSSFFPLAVNDSWSYKLRNYDTATGATIDSSFFTLSISSTVSANGAVYYQFQNSPDTTILESLAPINSTSLGSVDNAFGTQYYTFFVSGSGDSTASVTSWPVKVSNNGNTCQGTDKLYAHYADTTLVNLDGTVYTSCQKNVIETFDCSGNKLIANLYYVKSGTGLVRFARYVYNKSDKPVLQLAWVLESETLN